MSIRAGNKPIDISVDEYTSPCDEPVEPTTPISKIIAMFKEENYRHMPVVLDGKPIGIISSRDLKFISKLDIPNVDLEAQDFMTPDPYTVQTGTMLTDVAYEMSQRKIGSALVVNSENHIEGIFTTTDALNALVEITRGEYE
ncbi:MAG: CBS domain-containing protein [Bacteriovoracaceae bacterium]